jgi:putative addiction module component (TIGR02574 family)
MSREATELLKRALSLNEEERALLAGSLLESLDSASDIDAELSWQLEIGRRLDELDLGNAKTIPWTEVRKRLAANRPRIS